MSFSKVHGDGSLLELPGSFDCEHRDIRRDYGSVQLALVDQPSASPILQTASTCMYQGMQLTWTAGLDNHPNQASIASIIMVKISTSCLANIGRSSAHASASQAVASPSAAVVLTGAPSVMAAYMALYSRV
jgi:hypothetical protein